MRMNFIFPLLCFTICVKALTYTAPESTSTPKAGVFRQLLQATAQPTANDTINNHPASVQRRNKNLKKVIHNKGGTVAGSGAAHSAPGKSRNGASSLLQGRPFSILSFTTGHIIVEFLVFVCLFMLT